MTDPTPDPTVRPGTPADRHRAELTLLCDLLVVKPLPRREALRGRVLDALRACEASGEHALADHLLRNLLWDLSRRGSVDGSYFARQLVLAGDLPSG